MSTVAAPIFTADGTVSTVVAAVGFTSLLNGDTADRVRQRPAQSVRRPRRPTRASGSAIIAVASGSPRRAAPSHR